MAMKKVKIITALAVSATLLSTTMLSAFATEPGGELDSYGTITYEASEDPTDPTDPEDPGEIVIPDDGEGPTDGPLSIDFVSNLRFGTQKISSKNETYNAAPQILWKVDQNGEKIPEASGGKLVRANYVQVTDNRGEEEGWTLTVEQTTEFTGVSDSSKTLEGTEISIPALTYVPVTEDSDVGTTASSITLGYGEDAVTVMDAEEGEGAGTHIAKLGALTGEAGEEMSTITLTVPGSVAKYAIEYETVITWTLGNTP